MAKPKKRIDRYTLFRFKREARCFDPSHEKERLALLKKLERAAKTIAALEEREGRLLADRESTLEEAEKTAYLKGFHEGEKAAKAAAKERSG